MHFNETRLKGSFVIELEKIKDDRGFFSRAWCQKEFLSHGLNHKIVQCNLSFNAIKDIEDREQDRDDRCDDAHRV